MESDRERLATRGGSGRPGARRKVTIDTVADAASVSRQTVTNTLHYPERVRPATLERVKAEIERLGYQPSAAARSLRALRSGAVGFELNGLGPDYHNALMAPLLAQLSVAATDHESHIVTFGSSSRGPMLDAYSQMWQSQRVDAFVIADTHPGDPRPPWLLDHDVPFVAFGRVWDDPSFSRWVDVDGRDGTRQAVAHCLAQGYTQIAYLGWPEGASVVSDDRRRGWREMCGAHGLAQTGLDASAIEDLGEAVAVAEGLVDRLRPGGAIVCASDVLAVGVHQVLTRRGIHPGGGIGIVGFDDSELARMHGLSSMTQPLPNIAEHLLRLLRDCFSGLPPPANGVLLSPWVHPRSSTRITTTNNNNNAIVEPKESDS